MKLTYKGIFKDMEQLPKGKLPENAVKFNEPNDMKELEATLHIYLAPPLIAIALAVIVAFLLHGGLRFSFGLWPILVGLGLSFASLIIHEILHAICVPWGARVELYIAPSKGMLFVHTTAPISKARFIFMSLFPNILLGWIPLIIWVVVTLNPVAGTALFIYAITMTLSGCGDYMNSINAWRQMPRGSMQQLSGFNSYWFMP